MALEEISSLVKYCTTDTGLKVLNSQSLRWSAPHLINDPFELSHLTDAEITQESLLKGMIKEAINMLFGPTEPTGKNNRLVAAISRWRDEERFASEDEAEQVLTQLLGQIAQQQMEGITDYLSSWKQFSSHLRLCSFSDKPNNMHCWQRYAEDHTGIAIRFAAGEDTALPDPKRVSYSTIPPNVSSLKQQVAVTYGKESPPSADGFLKKMLEKNKINNVEREWRCFGTEAQELDDNDQLWYSNKKFSAPELKAVYLGLGIQQSDRDTVIAIVKEKYRNTKVYQAKALPNRYEIDFDQVATR